MRPGRWLDRQTKERPFLSALVALLLVGVPGYFRLETSVDTSNKAAEAANKTAQDLIKFIEDEQLKLEEQNLFICQTRNTASKNGRDRFEAFILFLEVSFVGDPEQTEAEKERAQKFIDRLRESIPLDPALEDIDCNGDGELGPGDYA